MKFKKKTCSLVTKEIVNAVGSLFFMFIGVVALVNPELLKGKQVLMIPILVFCVGPIALRFFVKFDMRDEAAVEHYDKAKKKVLDLIWWLLAFFTMAGLFFFFLAEKPGNIAIIEININFWYFFVAFELIEVAISTLFIYYEKREA